jgi:hypothetical protein
MRTILHVAIPTLVVFTGERLWHRPTAPVATE